MFGESQVKRSRIDQSFVTIGGMDFLVNRLRGADWDRAVAALLEVCARAPKENDPSWWDEYWRRLLGDHIPGLQNYSNFMAVRDKTNIEELSGAASVIFGIPFDLKRQD